MEVLSVLILSNAHPLYEPTRHFCRGQGLPELFYFERDVRLNWPAGRRSPASAGAEGALWSALLTQNSASKKRVVSSGKAPGGIVPSFLIVKEGIGPARVARWRRGQGRRLARLLHVPNL